MCILVADHHSRRLDRNGGPVVQAVPARIAPALAAPEPDVTCIPSKLDPRIIQCSDGRSLRFDWNALLEILEQPRLHFLTER